MNEAKPWQPPGDRRAEWAIIDQGTTEAVRQMRQQGRTYPDHDCYAWNVQHYWNTRDANWRTCGTCRVITGFRWKSWRRRWASFLLGTAADPR